MSPNQRLSKGIHLRTEERPDRIVLLEHVDLSHNLLRRFALPRQILQPALHIGPQDLHGLRLLFWGHLLISALQEGLLSRAGA